MSLLERYVSLVDRYTGADGVRRIDAIRLCRSLALILARDSYSGISPDGCRISRRDWTALLLRNIRAGNVEILGVQLLPHEWPARRRF